MRLLKLDEKPMKYQALSTSALIFLSTIPFRNVTVDYFTNIDYKTSPNFIKL